MKREDIIRMAREGCDVRVNARGRTSYEFDEYGLENFANVIAYHLKQNGWRKCADGQRTTQYCGLAEQARLEEREACAKVAELVAREIDDTNGTATYIAAAIRARGDK